MLRRRRGVALALVAGWFGAAVLMASPAQADVDCVDLGSRAAAQAYYDGHAGDPDHLDTDGDGRACEGSAPHSGGTWTLVLLGVLMAAGLVRYTTFTRDPARTGASAQEEAHAEVPEPVEAVAVGAPTLIALQGGAGPLQRRDSVVRVALTGSVTELARALRMVRYGERMGLLEAHASAHGSTPRQVLDALARTTSDLELQGWALAGYDPPWTVRVLRCSCVDGLRNFQLRSADDGSHYWECVSCHQPVHASS